MPDRFADIVLLVYRSFSGEITAEEQVALDEWLSQSDKRAAWYQSLQADGLQQAMQTRTPEQRAQLREDIHQRIRVATGISTLLTTATEEPQTIISTPIHRIHLLKTAWFKYAAAILITLGIGAYLWNTQTKEKPAETVQTTPVPLKNDVPPGGDKAILTLADGSTINLDSAQNGIIAAQQAASIVKKDGRILYDTSVHTKNVVGMNKIETPRGGQYAVLLPDGTNAWLNAESSITYPSAFTGKQRNVSMSGEVYFEVAKDAKHPFVVQTSTDTISVLGTHFNVNAYADEGVVTTTLLEGKVKVDGNAGGNGYTRVLHPGQANVNGQVEKANVQQAVAWKNGEFQFAQADIAAVMRQLARWYDIEVEYRGDIKARKFGGAIKRNLSLADLLEGLQSTGLKFTIEGKKLIVQ